MMRIRILGGLVLAALAVTLLTGGDVVHLSAQENASPTATPPPTATPLPTPTAYPLQRMGFNLLATADIQLATDGPSYVRVASLTVAPGVASLPFTNEGPTLIAVTGGRITLESDQAAVTITDIAFVAGLEPVGGTPGPVSERAVSVGEQIFLPAGSTTTIRNDTTANATIVVVAVVPFPATTPTP
jgi:hypothetical protein